MIWQAAGAGVQVLLLFLVEAAVAELLEQILREPHRAGWSPVVMELHDHGDVAGVGVRADEYTSSPSLVGLEEGM